MCHDVVNLSNFVLIVRLYLLLTVSNFIIILLICTLNIHVVKLLVTHYFIHQW